jgi:hypothetical protein
LPTSAESDWKAKDGDMMCVSNFLMAFSRSRCIEHAVHIASKHFVEKVAPTPPKPLNKKIWQLLDQACESGEINKDEVNKVLSTLGEEEKDDSCAETDLEWTAGDAVGKLLALIKQVSACVMKYSELTTG